MRPVMQWHRDRHAVCSWWVVHLVYVAFCVNRSFLHPLAFFGYPCEYFLTLCLLTGHREQQA